MAEQPPQHDWEPDVSEFMRWVGTQSVLGILGPVPAANHPFMPLPRLETYLKEENRTRKLLAALFPNGDPPVEPEEIWRNCIRVFGILLLIGKGSFIQHFVQHNQLWDGKLPMLSRPRDFPPTAGDNRFFELFFQKQWQFCPYNFRHNEIHAHLDKECILPIVHKEQLGDGGSALTYRIKLHPAYDDLTAPADIRRDPGYRYANTYVLKTYRSKDARDHYHSEVKAFKALMPGGALGKSIIGFHGSFIQDGSYNVLLEYADRGTLEHYLEKTPPPTTGDDIYKFWRAAFNLIKALKLIHDVQPIDPTDPPVLRGWHQDVKPTNILVTSGKSGSDFDCEFKLADLGLSHFRRVAASQGADSDKDTSGTREYGAPECYRFDQFMERSPLHVKQSVDIWSLGCVYSEVAVWVVRNQRDLARYRQNRQDETRRIYDFRDGGCFHDGKEMLQSVNKMHAEVFEDVRGSDHVTKSVVKKMIDEMLDTVEGRPTAIQSWSKCQKILRDAETKLKASKPEQSEPDLFAKGERSQTFGHPRGRVPPVVPPGVPHSQSEKFTSNGNQGSWPPLRGHKGQQRSATVNDHTREHTPSPEPNTDDAYETPDEMSYISSTPTSPPDILASNNGQHRRVTSTGTKFHPTSPDQISETDEPRRNKSIKSHGKARERDSTLHGRSGSGQNQDPHLSQPMLGPNIRSLADNTVKQSAEIQGSPQVDSDPFQSHPVQNRTATMVTVPPDTKKPAPRQMPPHLSVAGASQWILNKKHQGPFSGLENKVYLNELQQRDHIFLVDDAASMRPYWPDVTSVLHVLAYMLKDCDKDGMDLYFTISPSKCNSKNSAGLLQHIRGRSLLGTSDIGSRLTTILHGYETALRRHASKRWPSFGRSKTMKPLNVYILTDAIWQPHSDAAEPIKSLIGTMVDLRYPRKQVGIQFIHFGKNEESFKKLERLDSGLGLSMDIVDAEPADGNVWKMLLGAVNKWFDGDDNGEV